MDFMLAVESAAHVKRQKNNDNNILEFLYCILQMNKILYFFLLIWFTSCNKEVNLKCISLNFDNTNTILIDTANVIELETAENSLLYDIGHIEFLGDKYFIFSRNSVCVFDLQGHFLFNLSNRGEAPDEYLSVHNICSDGENIFLYDFVSGKVLKFDTNGDYISDIKIKRKNNQPTPAKIYNMDSNTFLSYNSYSGEGIQVPVFSRWNKELNKQNYIEGRALQSGLRFPDGCFIDCKKRILYWETSQRHII